MASTNSIITASTIISIILLLLITTSIDPINGAKILAVLTTPSRSHFIIQSALMKGLADRGHDITVAMTLPPEKLKKNNYRQVYLQPDESTAFSIDEMMSDVVKNSNGETENFLKRIPNLIKTILKRSNDSVNHPDFQKLMNEEQFDLVALGWFVNDFQLGIAAHFRCPSIVIWTGKPMKHLMNYIGSPTDVASHVPHMLLNYDDIPMTFFQRFKNFIVSIIEDILLLIYSYIQNIYYQSNFPSDKYPSLEDVKKNVSLVLVNHHFSEGGVRPLIPGVIEVGGMQVKSKPDPLPEDLKSFLDTAKDGAILFSLGSNVKSSQMSVEKRDILIKVFSRLKQKIIWKWEDDVLPGKPNNVYIGKWLPQDDILAHPNIKLFISHCGLGGIVESKYHGVPILGMPFFGDQASNLKKIINEGWALESFYHNLDENSMYNTIMELLTNSKYKNNIDRISKLYKDRPHTPLETAIYWVEYILRYDGAKHMQSPAVHLNFIQYHSIDVMLSIFVLIIISYQIIKFIGKFLMGKICKNVKNKRKTE